VGSLPKTILVIPCFNEAKRLDLSQFEIFLQNGNFHLIFVDDGSTDDTYSLLDNWSRNYSECVQIVRIPTNKGKAEAVRQGLLAAIHYKSQDVGYADADLATPASEIMRLADILRTNNNSVYAVLGSRIRRLGASISRNPVRHYLGRWFATMVSLLLGIPIYDSQCGAKFFRNNTALRSALQHPFRSRWIFDVELIARLLKEYGKEPLRPAERFLEVPLLQWREIQGSNIRLRAFVWAGIDLIRISVNLSSRN